MAEHIIFHIDVNSAFLSWTALHRLKSGETVDLREIPSIIGGDMSTRHGVVLAKSIPAKTYGITTGEPVVNAFRKCPNLISVAPDHRLYSHMSQQLMEYLSGICPEIEQVSIDECYMDYLCALAFPVSASPRTEADLASCSLPVRIPSFISQTSPALVPSSS